MGDNKELVDRLRALARHERTHAYTGRTPDEAADAIERLVTECHGHSVNFETATDELDEANERTRVAVDVADSVSDKLDAVKQDRLIANQEAGRFLADLDEANRRADRLAKDLLDANDRIANSITIDAACEAVRNHCHSIHNVPADAEACEHCIGIIVAIRRAKGLSDIIDGKPTDTDRLDWLEKHGKGVGWVCRESLRGRGWRLHETTHDDAKPTPREAIDDAMGGE